MLKYFMDKLRDAVKSSSAAQHTDEDDDPFESGPDLLSDVALRHTKRLHCCSGMAHKRSEDVADLRFPELHART